MKEKETYFCKNCDAPFEYKRIDQKFCSASCRYQFNNSEKRIKYKEIKYLVNNFIRNHELLEKFYRITRGRMFYDLSRMIRQGFVVDCISKPYYCTELKTKMKKVGSYAFCVNEERTKIKIVKID
jgi:predicted nucleic acid-binding Zn ribbon protein